MKNSILADTTIWIEFFRGRSKIADRLEMLLIEHAICTCGVVLFEILQGIKSETEKNKVLNIFIDLPYIEMTKALWVKASELSQSLKKNGINLPLSDIFIATIAIENKLSVFTLDDHFNQIPNLNLYSL